MSYDRFTLDEKMVLRYVIPFYFDSASAETSTERYGMLCRALEEAPLWTLDRPDRKERDVYDYIVGSLYPDSGCPAIGSSWHYDFKNKKKKIRYAAAKEAPVYYNWAVKEAGVYLFKSNVGFLWYELIPDGKERPVMNADEFIVFQNSFKELCRRNRPHVLEEFIPPTGKGADGSYRDFHPGRWVCGLLEPILSQIGFQGACRIRKDPEGEEKISAPDKALLFHYILVNASEPRKVEDEVQLREMAYLLSSGQTSKYILPDDLAEQTVSPFGGVCWHASKGGCGYYALRNPKNQAFFTGDLPQRIRENYFLLYILVLHQSYSLANYLRRIAVELPAETEEYIVPTPAGRHLDELVAEVNTFLMKSMYFSVSSVQHQNVFFEYLQKRLRVREDIAGIDSGTNAVVKLQRIRKEAEEERILQCQEEQERVQRQREENNDRTLNITMCLLSLFAVLSALNDFTQLMDALKGAPWKLANLLDTETWGLIAEHMKANAPGSVLTLLGYLLILGLSALCICVVGKASLRHFGIGRAVTEKDADAAEAHRRENT